jgi:hypothetical protein
LDERVQVTHRHLVESRSQHTFDPRQPYEHHNRASFDALLVVPKSLWRPHAVRVNNGFRYPQRDGAGTRYLSESEVADAYGNRFEQAAGQTAQLDEMWGTLRGFASDVAWLAIAVVPDAPGLVPVNYATLDAYRSWVVSRCTSMQGSPLLDDNPKRSIGVQRFTIVNRRQPNGQSRGAHFEFDRDGAALLALELAHRDDRENDIPVPGE